MYYNRKENFKNKRRRALSALLLSVILTLALACGSVSAAALPDDSPKSQLFFASDYQGTPANANLKKICKRMKSAGADPSIAVWCGDYVDGSVGKDGSNTSRKQMKGHLKQIKSAMSARWPGIKYRFIQGNHDYSGFVKNGTITSSGPKEMENCILYILNEDDYPWRQGVSGNAAKSKKTVKKTAKKLKTYFEKLIDEGCDKPVIIATHVPLHWSLRSTTKTSYWRDNIYANLLFSEINKAAESLDIVYVFGHNHSKSHDNAIGGSVNFLAPGELVRIPNGKNGRKNYTQEMLRFTYMNAGYIGKIDSGLKPHISTASLMTFSGDAIHLEKYSADGLYPAASRTILLH